MSHDQISKLLTPVEAVKMELIAGVRMTEHGLQIDRVLEQQEWMVLGSHLARLAHSVMWALGDWLAYGQEHYVNAVWGKQMPHEVYARVAEVTGYAESTLRNAKWVCLKLKPSLRKDKLTFSHAQAIVAKAKPGQFRFWVDRVVEEELTVKQVWQELRTANAIYQQEPNDDGEVSLLERCRQFQRDFCAMIPAEPEAVRREAAKILRPVFEQCL